MILSASEIKRQIIEQTQEDVKPPEWESKKSDYAEVGQHIKRMTGTNGWKILELWLVRKLDLNVILYGTDKDRVRAEAFADVLKQVSSWIRIGEQANSEMEIKNTERKDN